MFIDRIYYESYFWTIKRNVDGENGRIGKKISFYTFYMLSQPGQMFLPNDPNNLHIFFYFFCSICYQYRFLFPYVFLKLSTVISDLDYVWINLSISFSRVSPMFSDINASKSYLLVSLLFYFILFFHIYTWCYRDFGFLFSFVVIKK